MKFSVIAAVLSVALLSSGCASTDATRSEAARDESCRVTGSNLPKRECRGDVTVLPPSALEKVGASPPSGKGS